MEDKPQYIHDCPDCRFLGKFIGPGLRSEKTKYDLYYCPNEPTHLARFENNGPNYTSGVGSTYNEGHPLREAHERSVKLGHLYIGDFIVTEEMITDRRFNRQLPITVSGYFQCSNLGLTSLEGSPRLVGDYFSCANNYLETLKGGPTCVATHYNCAGNQLKNLEHVADMIGGRIIHDENLYDLSIEAEFSKKEFHSENYFGNLLKYIITNKYNEKHVKGWPEGFLNKITIKSLKPIYKYNL